MRKFRALPSLERMEDRLVPATVKFISGALYISNPTITSGTAALTVTQKAPNTFQVVDGSSTLGTYGGVGNVYITGSNSPDKITFNVDTFTYSGSLYINGQNGNDTIAINGGHGAGAGSGAINGNVTLQHAYGNESVNLNSNGTGGLTIGGTTNVTTSYGSDSYSLGSGSTGGVTKFLGDVNLTGAANVILGTGGQADYYGHNVTVSEGVNTGLPMYFFQGLNADQSTGGNVVSTIQGSLSITGGNGSAPAKPAGTIGNQISLGALNVAQNVSISVGPTSSTLGNSVGISNGRSGITTINGNFNFNASSGLEVLDLSGGVIYGSTNLQMGSGTSLLGLENGSLLSGANAPTYFGGNVTVNQSGGSLTVEGANAVAGTSVGDPNAPVQATFAGNLAFYVQNSDLTVPIDSSYTTIGGKYIVNAGNGSNSFSFGIPPGSLRTSLAPTYNLDFTLGNGTNALTVTDPNVTLTGRVIAGTGTNTYSSNGQIQSPWEINF